MVRLRLSALADEKPVKITLELPGSLFRNLQAYATALASETGAPQVAPERLISPMLERFMDTDRAFAKHRKNAPDAAKGS